MSPSILIALASSLLAAAPDSARLWVGTWTTAPQLVEQSNMPPSPGLANNTLRQIVRVSLGGDTLRLRLSNDFSTATTVIQAASIAISKGGGAIDASTSKPLLFGGKPGVTLAANGSALSDPLPFAFAARSDLAITLHYGTASSSVTGHPGSRTTSYLLAGDKTSSADFAGATKTEHWYTINTLETRAGSSAGAVAILGNSITDGRGSTTDQQNRWPDILSETLLKNTATSQVGVLNLGIGGNCVLSGGLGPTGVSRFPRDILQQSGVRWVVIFEGVNDIGGVTSAAAATTMSNNLIAAYKQMTKDAHAKGFKVYGATIMPFNGNSYYNASSEQCRSKVNAWIRSATDYDGVIDFDRIMRSSTDTTKLGTGTFQNDGLHPDATAYRKMGSSVELSLFALPASGVDRFRRDASAPERGTAGMVEFGAPAAGVIVGDHRIDGRATR